MDWLSPGAVLTVLACCLPLLRSVAVTHTRDTATPRVINLKRTPGGTSRGGASLSRDEIRDRLSKFRHSILKGLGAAFDTGPKEKGPVDGQPCSLQNPDDIQRMLPGRFLSEDDLMHIVPGTKSWVSDAGQMPFIPQRRLVTMSGKRSESSQFEQQAAFNIKSGTAQFLGNSFCGSCLTEIGYEIVDQIVDFSGRNHTVINFKNAYQFIPSGLCLNENSPCGVGGSRCRQITRAHWSLVWTTGIGVNLVAHEVPSHCECLNLGAVQLRSAQNGQAGSGAAAFGVAGLKMDTVHEESPLPLPTPIANSTSGAGFGSSSVSEDSTLSLTSSSSPSLSTTMLSPITLSADKTNSSLPDLN